MFDVVKYNEALGSAEYRERGLSREQVEEYGRKLRQSSVLDHTRSFVCWVAVESNPPRVSASAFAAPERIELARGLS